MNVLGNSDVFAEITAFMTGRCAKHWTNGDLALRLGLENLIRQQIHTLCFTSIDSLIRQSPPNFSLLEFLYLHGHRWSIQAFDVTAATGPLSVLEWLAGHCQGESFNCTHRALDNASEHGHVDIVKWLVQAFASGQVVAFDNTTNVHAMDLAAAGGHVEVLEILHTASSLNVKATTAAMDVAAAQGHVKVLNWLRMNRREGHTAKAIYGAASNGHLDCVQWLHTASRHLNAGWDARIMDAAAANGHLEIVKFLHTNRREGCTSMAMSLAAANGHLDVVEFLFTHRRELCTEDALDWAASVGQLASVEWLHAHAAHLPISVSVVAMDEAASHNYMDVVQFLHTHRNEGCTKSAMDNAAANGHLEMVKWLHKNRSEGCTEWAICLAALADNVDILEFLWRQRVECQGYDALDAARMYAGEGSRVRAWVHEKLDESTNSRPSVR
ncbi:Ankyrin repeat and SAM domain-containing protein 3 [Aphanomyces cochlioides]|nr:Ankyrin repeat and SAM domain-containing protein 3 [Aphanomyces cochlioides]